MAREHIISRYHHVDYRGDKEQETRTKLGYFQFSEPCQILQRDVQNVT